MNVPKAANKPDPGVDQLIAWFEERQRRERCSHCGTPDYNLDGTLWCCGTPRNPNGPEYHRHEERPAIAALKLCVDAIDRLMGDTDMDNDRSVEMQAIRAAMSVLDDEYHRGAGQPANSDEGATTSTAPGQPDCAGGRVKPEAPAGRVEGPRSLTSPSQTVRRLYEVRWGGVKK